VPPRSLPYAHTHLTAIFLPAPPADRSIRVLHVYTHTRFACRYAPFAYCRLPTLPACDPHTTSRCHALRVISAPALPRLRLIPLRYLPFLRDHLGTHRSATRRSDRSFLRFMRCRCLHGAAIFCGCTCRHRVTPAYHARDFVTLCR